MAEDQETQKNQALDGIDLSNPEIPFENSAIGKVLKDLKYRKRLDFSPVSLVFLDPMVESAYQEEQNIKTRTIMRTVLIFLSLYILGCNLSELLVKNRQSHFWDYIWFVKVVANFILFLTVLVNNVYKSFGSKFPVFSCIFYQVLVGICTFPSLNAEYALSVSMSLLSLGRNTFLLPFIGSIILNVPIIAIVTVQIVFVIVLPFLLHQVAFQFPPPVPNCKYEWIVFVAFLVENTISILACFIFSKEHRIGFAENVWYRFTENRALREESHIKQEILKQKGQYIAQVAHDFGTPLTTFSLTLELLKEFLVTEEQQDILETARTAVEHMTVTRLEALDHAKHMEGLQLRPNIKQVNLREIMKKCARIMAGYSGACDIPLEFFTDPDMPKILMSDYEWVWTMIVNYLSNAKKYSSKGRILTTSFIMPGQATFRVEVADEGIGIPEDRKHQLFSAFGQLQLGAGGTGLGLHGVSVKAKALGGSVGVFDNPYSISGSTFWVELPLVKLADTPVSVFELPAILLIGEWSKFPFEPRLMSYLEARYEAIYTLDSIGEITTIPLHERTTFSCVLWLLDEEMVEKSRVEFISMFSLAKEHWTSPSRTQAVTPKVLVVPRWTQQSETLRFTKREKVDTYRKIRSRQTSVKARSRQPTEATDAVSRSNLQCFNEVLKSTPLSRISFVSPTAQDVDPRNSPSKSVSIFDFDVVKSPMSKHGKRALAIHWTKDVLSESNADFDERKASAKVYVSSDDELVPRSQARSSRWRSASSPRFGALEVHDLKPRRLSKSPQSSMSLSLDSFKFPSPLTSPHLRKFKDTGLHLRLTSARSERNLSASRSRLISGSNSRLVTNVSFGSQPPGIVEIAIQEAAKTASFQLSYRQITFDGLLSFLAQVQASKVITTTESNYFSLNNYRQISSDPARGVNTGNEVDETFTTDTFDEVHDILVVDDDPTVLKFLNQIFKKSGYSVRTATNGFEGLTALKFQSFKIAFIDRNMPVMDGLECIRRFRAWEKSILSEQKFDRGRQHIAVFSANVYDANIKEALAAGADQFVSKPVKIQVLLDCVRAVAQPGTNTEEPSGLYMNPLKSFSNQNTIKEETLDSSADYELRGTTPMHGSNMRKDSSMQLLSAEQRETAYKVLPLKEEDEFVLQSPPIRRLKPLQNAVQPFKDLERQQVATREILLVDDDLSILKFTKRIMEKNGFMVGTCSNGLDALEKMKENPNLHAVVIDMQMPIMGGKECVEKFREWEEHQISSGIRVQKLGIIIVSGSDREEAAGAKATAVLSKPIQTEELIHTISSLYSLV